MLTYDPTTRRFSVRGGDGVSVSPSQILSLSLPLPESTREARRGEYAVGPDGGLYRSMEGRLTWRWWPSEGRWRHSYYGTLRGARRFFGQVSPSRGAKQVILETSK
jgi:hypothetical protein